MPSRIVSARRPDPSPPLRTLGRRLAPAVLAGSVIAFAFVAFFTSALHNPTPNALRVGVVGPQRLVSDVRARLDQAVPGGFELRRYDQEGAARSALRSQETDGVFLSEDGRPRLLVAGADGANVTTVLHAAFGAAAAAQGQKLTTQDVAPLPRHDARGISAFFVVAGTTLGSLAFSTALFFLGGHAGHAPLRLRLALIVAFAVVTGVVVSFDTAVLTDGLSSATPEVAGIIALLAMAISLTATSLVRWIGAPALGIAVVFLMLFSLPATGGPIGPEFVPDVYRWIAPALPSHAALEALKGVVYFGGRGTTAPLLVLGAWIVGAAAVSVAAHALRREPPTPPVIGTPRAIIEAAL
jgi:hypothetical protein